MGASPCGDANISSEAGLAPSGSPAAQMALKRDHSLGKQQHTSLRKAAKSMPEYAKKARPIGRALFGAIIAIHTARVTLPLRRQRVHA